MKNMNIEEFCKQIKFPQKQYYDIVNLCKAGKGYCSFKLPKKSGGERTIYVPQRTLKSLQRKIKNYLETKYRPLYCCHGFIEKRSCVTNAIPHVNKKWCLNFDLADFFPSINFGRILGLFTSQIFEFNNRLATTLAIICCYKGALPQGAPTSPILANMICYNLDKKMIELAKENRCIYSRYCDDITLSTNLNSFPSLLVTYYKDQDYVDLSPELYKIVNGSGFIVNTNKTRLAEKNKCQMVTGIIVNKKLNLKRKYYRNLRAILYNCKKEGLLATALKNGLKNETELLNFILGKMAYYQSVVGAEHESYNKLCKMFNDNVYYKFKNCFYNLKELMDNSLFIIENDIIEKQGTAFLTEDNKLYTCKHCIVKLGCTYTEDELKSALQKLEKSIKIFKSSSPNDEYHVKNIKLLENDVAEMEIVGYTTNIKFKFSKKDILEPGNMCTMIGFPSYSIGDTPNVQQVKISSKRRYMGCNYFTIDKYIITGASGGPVLNGKCEVVGMIERGGADLDDASKTDANMFIPVSEIKQ